MPTWIQVKLTVSRTAMSCAQPIMTWTKAQSDSSKRNGKRADGQRGGELALRLLEQRDDAGGHDGHGGNEPQNPRDGGSGEFGE